MSVTCKAVVWSFYIAFWNIYRNIFINITSLGFWPIWIHSTKVNFIIFFLLLQEFRATLFGINLMQTPSTKLTNGNDLLIDFYRLFGLEYRCTYWITCRINLLEQKKALRFHNERVQLLQKVFGTQHDCCLIFFWYTNGSHGRRHVKTLHWLTVAKVAALSAVFLHPYISTLTGFGVITTVRFVIITWKQFLCKK